jgi:hypothetical protein
LFIDRDREVGRVRKALDQGLNCVVHGERGAGKTSLVRRVMYLDGQHQLGDKDFVFINGAGKQTPQELLAGVVHATQPAAGVVSEQSSPALLQRLRTWAGQSSRRIQPILVVDDPDPHVANRLLGALRDDLWDLEVPWLVTVATSGLRELLLPPVDAFFETQVQVGGLDDEDAATFLETRLRHRLPVSVVHELVAAAGGNPRRLLDLGRAAVVDGGALIVRGQRTREAALARLGRPAQMLFFELEAQGPSSASDPDLLASMGWTRARATQVLHGLEAAGLVSSELVKPAEGGGRPRRVYAVVPLSDLAGLAS